MQKQPIHFHAPYCYLSENTEEGNFDLFVAIPQKEGYRVITEGEMQAEVQYLNDMTVVNIKMEPTGSNEPEEIYTAYFALQPEEIQDVTFNLDTAQLAVQVSVFENSEVLEEVNISTLLYRDRDYQQVEEGARADGIAYNCPYSFLREVDSENSSTQGAFRYAPYLFVPLRGYELKQENFLLTTPNNGICETVLVLSRNEEGNTNEVSFEHNFKVNDSYYRDSGRIEGNFIVTLLFEENVPGPSSDELSLEAIYQILLDLDLETNETPQGENAPIGTEGQPDEAEGVPTMVPPEAAEPANPVVPVYSGRYVKTRNMSSRGRSPIFLDIMAAF